MALPFEVYDPDYSDLIPAYVWCVRCKDRIPLTEAYGAAYDPHAYDHVKVWMEFKKLDNLELLERAVIDAAIEIRSCCGQYDGEPYAVSAWIKLEDAIDALIAARVV